MRRLPLILSQSWDGPDGRHYAWSYTEGQRERWFVDGEEIPRPLTSWFDVEPTIDTSKVVWPRTECCQPGPRLPYP